MIDYFIFLNKKHSFTWNIFANIIELIMFFMLY